MVENDLKYSVWFVPEATAEAPFTQLVSELAQEYQAPIFVPHLTLAADLEMSLPEVLAVTQTLADQTLPFDINFTEVGTGDTYFQCVFLKAIASPELWQARQRAAEEYQRPELVEKFMPHLSLLYGTFDDTVKTRARDRVAAAFVPLSFRATKLVVYTAEPDPTLWKQVGTIPMKVRA